MAFENAILGNGHDFDPAAVTESLLRQAVPEIPANSPIDIRDVNTRILRKIGQPSPNQATEPVAAPKAPLDFSDQASPPPSNEVDPSLDFSSQAVSPPTAAEPAPTVTVGGRAKTFGKGLAHAAIEGTGGVIKGLGQASSPDTISTAVQTAAAGFDPANEWTLPGERPNPEAPNPGNPMRDSLIASGKATQKFAQTVAPMSDQEKASMEGRVGMGVGGILPYIAAGAVNPVLGLVAGGVGMAAQSYGDTYDEAIKKGASDDDAAKAAGYNGLVGGALGVVPLGVVLTPVKKFAPGLTGWAAGVLDKYVSSSAFRKTAASAGTMAAVVEAQEYLGDQIAQHFYEPKYRDKMAADKAELQAKIDRVRSDPALAAQNGGWLKEAEAGVKSYDDAIETSKRGYSPEIKRVIASLITGGILGLGHHAFERWQDGKKPADQPNATEPADATQPAADSPGAEARQRSEGDLPPPAPEWTDIPGDEGADNPGTRGWQRPPPGGTGARGAGPEPGPDTGGPGNGKTGPEAEPGKPPPGTGEGKGQDFTMDAKTRSKMERVYRHFEPGTDPSRMSDADLYNAVNEHLRDTSSTGYTAKSETAEEAAAREAAATERTEREALKRRGWTDAHIDNMSPEQRRKYFQDAMRGEQAAPPKEAATATGTRDEPIKPTSADDILKAQPVEPKSPAQAEAENFKHAHVELEQFGLTGKNSISVETGVGQERKGVDADGKPWSVTMEHAAYGRIKGTKGADGQPIDIFVGPHPTSPHVFVLDQHHPGGGGFDEHKVLAGFRTPIDAMHAYANSYADGGGDRIGHVTAMGPEEFKDWLKNGDHTKQLGPQKAEAPKPRAAVAKPRAGSDQPMSLLQFIASKGGIKPEPDLIAMDAHKHRVQIPGRAGFFGIVKETGEDLDRMREMAEEAGYLSGEHGKTATPRDLKDLMDAELRDQKRYAEGEELTTSKRDRKLAAERERHERERHEIEYGDATRNLIDSGYQGLPTDLHDAAIRLMVHDGLDPDAAVERAALRLVAEDPDYQVTPDAITDTFGGGAYDAIRTEPASEDGKPSAREREEEPGPRESEEASGHGERVPAAGQEVSEATEAGQQRVIPGGRKTVSLEEVRKEAAEYPSAGNFAYVANRKYGLSTEKATEIWNEARGKPVEIGVDINPPAWAPKIGDTVSLSANGGKTITPYKITNYKVVDGEWVFKATDPRGGSLTDSIETLRPKENGADNKDQLVIPGAERIGQGQLAQRKANERLKPAVAQKAADEGLFGDEKDQTDLLDLTRQATSKIEDLLGPDADKIRQVDIARAAEILADSPDMPPAVAFSQAAAEGSIGPGLATQEQAEEIYGPEIKDILQPVAERAPENGAPSEPEAAENAAPAKTHSVAEGGSKGVAGAAEGRGEAANEPRDQADDAAGADANTGGKARDQAVDRDAVADQSADGNADRTGKPEPVTEAARRKAELDAPTWAQVLGELPKVTTGKYTNPDTDLAFRVMSEINGKPSKKQRFDKLTPEQKHELLAKLKAMKPEAAAAGTAPIPVADNSNWLKSLSPETKERVLVAMREVRKASDDILEKAYKLAPRNGERAVGGQHVDQFAQGESLAKLLSEIGKGRDIPAAAEAAKEAGREIGETYLKKNPDSVGVARDMVSSIVDRYADVIQRASRPLDERNTPTPKTKIEDFGEKIGGARKDMAVSTGERGKVEKPVDDRPTWAKRFEAIQSPKSGKWTVFDKRTERQVMDPRTRWTAMEFDSKDQAEAMIPLVAVAQKHRVIIATNAATGAKEYRIIRDVTDRKRVTIKDGFETSEEATRYLHDHAKDILETKTGFGEEILVTPEKAMREGIAHRKGDVRDRDFSDTFGFRGVEFGNWNNQAERQEVMNHAFDALSDLAALLNVPPKALSLNGELAIAFGARGQGLSGARAHYERDYGTINLTKMSGAGSLAHEWMHAFDHYLARLDSKAKGRITNAEGHQVFDAGSPGTDYITHGAGFKSKLRDELKAALKNVTDTIETKAENYVEDSQNADKWLGTAKERLAKQLDALRKNLAEEQQYGAKKKPANVEQLARFDALADKLRNGDDISTSWKTFPVKNSRLGVKGRWTNDTIEALSALYKEVRGRTGFTDNGGPMADLVHRVQDFQKRAKMMEDAAAQSVKTKRVPTQFVRDAYNLDQGRASDYWGTPHELAARAMSAYVEDKIAEQGGRSDFLSYGSDNAFYRIFNQRPFPEGTERQAINAAFDNLFKTIKTVPGKLGPDTALADMSARAVEKRPELENLVRAIVEHLVGDHVKIELSPDLMPLPGNASAAWGDMPNKGARGLYFPWKHLIRLAMVRGVDSTAFHESYHAIEFQLQTPQERRLMERETARLRDYVTQSRPRYSKEQIRNLAPEEVRAIAFEDYATARAEGRPDPGKGMHAGVRRWFERLWDALRKLINGLRGLGFKTYEDIFKKAFRGEYAEAKGDTPRAEAEGPALASIFTPDENPHGNTYKKDGSFDSSIEDVLGKRLLGRLSDLNLTEARTQLQDKFARVKNAEESVNAPSSLSAYQAESLYYGRTGHRLEQLTEHHIDPLIREMKARDIDVNSLDKFLYARHAPERNNKLGQGYQPGEQFFDAMSDHSKVGASGMSTGDALKIIRDIKAKGKLADYLAVAKMLDAINAKTRRTLFDAGLIDRDTFDDLNAKYKYYVPLRGWAEGSEHAESIARTGSGMGIKGKEFKQAFGRQSEAASPLAYSIMQAELAIVRAEKNKVGNTFLKFVRANPDPSRWTVDKAENVKRIDPETGLVTSIPNNLTLQADNVFSTKVDGKTVNITLKGPDGLNLARALKNMGTANVHALLRAYSTLTHTMAKLATSFNPDFMIPNFARDMGEAFINLQAQEQKGFVRNFLKHVPGAMRGAMLAISGKTPEPGTKMARYVDAFHRFDEAGGRIRFFGIDDPDQIEKNAIQKLKRLDGGALNTIKDIGDKAGKALEIAGGGIENATRLAAFMAAEDAGIPTADAAMMARNLTVDFNKKGELGGAISSLYMFANAGIQGQARMIKALGHRRVWQAVGALAGAAALSALYSILSGGEDSSGTPNYMKIEPWVRDKNLIFMLPNDSGYYVKVPLPYGFAPFAVTGAHSVAVMLGHEKPGKAASAIIDSIISAFNPLGEESSMWMDIVPSAIRPAFHNIFNKNWTGKPLYPEQDRNRGVKPNSTQFFKNDSAFSKESAKQLNAWSGGNAYQSGAIDVHPGSIDHTLQALGGGVGRFVKSLVDTAYSAINGDEWQPEKTPILRRFVGKVGEEADRAAYYEKRQEVRDREANIAQAKKDRAAGVNVDEAKEFLDSASKESRQKYIFENAEKQMKPLRKQETDITNSAVPYEVKQQELAKVRQKMRDIQNSARAASSRLNAPAQ